MDTKWQSEHLPFISRVIYGCPINGQEWVCFTQVFSPRNKWRYNNPHKKKKNPWLPGPRPLWQGSTQTLHGRFFLFFCGVLAEAWSALRKHFLLQSSELVPWEGVYRIHLPWLAWVCCLDLKKVMSCRSFLKWQPCQPLDTFSLKVWCSCIYLQANLSRTFSRWLRLES